MTRDSKDSQPEGLSDYKNKKYCPKCNFIDPNNQWKFCPNDGLKLKEPENILHVLDTEFPVGGKVIYDLGQYVELTFQKLNILGYRYISNPFESGGQYDYYVTQINNCISNKIKAHTLYSNLNLRDIIGIMVSLEMKNPIIRNGLVFRTETRIDQGTKKQNDDVIISLMDTNIGPQHGYSYFNGFYATTGLNSNDDDKKLRSLMNDVKEDVFYSRRNKKLYLATELDEILKLEKRIIKNFNLRERSKNIKVLNINAYVLNEEIDQLFEFVEFRQKINKLNVFKFNTEGIEHMSLLLGFK